MTDQRLAAATRIALDDPGTEKLRYLCWAVMGVRQLPKLWIAHDYLKLCDGKQSLDYEYVTPVQLVADLE